MLKLEDAVIHMQQNSDYLQLFPEQFGIKDLENKPTIPFEDEVVKFLNDLSSLILKDPESRSYPDVITFAFFCRKANLLKLKEKFLPSGLRLGRGIAFHIAPGNVPINFAYSLVTGLLAGNSNIVKLSSKPFVQVDIIIRHLKRLSNSSVAKRIFLLRYPHNSSATEILSSLSDVRIIWGGDHTIEEIKKNKIPSRTVDICFSDRYSLCAIKSSKVLNIKPQELSALSEKFYNDTFLFDQNACSAPHLVVWIGSKSINEKAKRIFWEGIYDFTKNKYSLQPVISVDKLNAMYKSAIDLGAIRNDMKDNLIVRAKLSELKNGIEDYRCPGGFFTEFESDSINSIQSIINQKFQTLSYYGFDRDELKDFILLNKPLGIDRIVPIGETTVFSLTWDGYDLINQMSRHITIL